MLRNDPYWYHGQPLRAPAMLRTVSASGKAVVMLSQRMPAAVDSVSSSERQRSMASL